MQTRTLKLTPNDIAKAKLFPSFKKKLELLYGRTEKDIDKLLNATIRKLNKGKRKKRKPSRGGHDSVFAYGAQPVNATAARMFRR